MKMLTPQQNQGQIVEVSFGWASDGKLYRKSFDRSDRTESWAVATNEEATEDWDEWTVPTGCKFESCEAPRE